MVPDNKILNRGTYNSYLTSAEYNPRTNIVKINHSRNDGILKNALNYNQSLMHEHVHWIQHHGTSMGCFLDALRATQTQITVDWLGDLPKNIRQQLLHHRFIKKQPILSITENFQPIYNNEHQKLDIFRQTWFDHQIFHTAFDNLDRLNNIKIPPGFVLGQVVSDIFVNLTSSHSIAETMEVRKWFSVEDCCSKAFDKKNHLTTSILMETPACLAELSIITESVFSKIFTKKELGQKIFDVLEKIISSSYGLGIKYFLDITRKELSELPQLSSTINLIAFIALNPPLPPFFCPPPKRSWEWMDLYPPLRFINLCNAVNKVGCVSLNCSDIEINEYTEKILDVTRLFFAPRDASIGVLHNAGFKAFSSNIGTSWKEEPLNFQGYALWVQSKLTEIWKKYPSIISSPARMFIGFGDSFLMRELINKNKHMPSYLTAPFLMENNKMKHSESEDFAGWLLLATGINYALYDFVVGYDNFDLSCFPSSFNTPERGEGISDFIKNMFL